MVQVHEKGVCRMSLCSLSRLLRSYVSPVFAVLARLLRHHFSVHTILPHFLVLQAQGMRISAGGRAVWLLDQVLKHRV